MGQLYLFKVFTFCKSLCVIDVRYPYGLHGVPIYILYLYDQTWLVGWLLELHPRNARWFSTELLPCNVRWMTSMHGGWLLSSTNAMPGEWLLVLHPCNAWWMAAGTPPRQCPVDGNWCSTHAIQYTGW